MRLPLRSILGTSGHDDLGDARLGRFRTGLILFGSCPFGAKFNNGVIKIDANTSTHANDHRFAFNRLQSTFIMLNEIGCNQGNPLGITDQCLKGGPLTFELLLFALFFPFGDFVKFVIDLRKGRLIERKLGDSAFVINGNRCIIGHRALNVINRNIITKNSPSIGIILFNGRSGEANKGGIRKRISEMPSESID